MLAWQVLAQELELAQVPVLVLVQVHWTFRCTPQAPTQGG